MSPESTPSKEPFSPLARQVLVWLAARSEPMWLVGGTLRDRLLGRAIHDIDLAVDGDGLVVARDLANAFGGSYYPLDEQRATGRALLDDWQEKLVIDIARLRAPDIVSDLADRDFTINALAAPVANPEQLLDPFGGRADLQAGRVRFLSEDSLRNDPLRMLRAIRLAAQLDFELTPEAAAQIRENAALLDAVSAERQRDELCRLLGLPHAAAWLRRMDELGLLAMLLPELAPLRGLTQSSPHRFDVLTHTLAVVEALETLFTDWGPLSPHADRLDGYLDEQVGTQARRTLLKLGALLHDVGKAQTRSVDPDGRIRFFRHAEVGAEMTVRVLKRLRFSRSEIRRVATVVRHHLRPILLANQEKVTTRAIYRFFRDTEPEGPAVLVHALADQRGTCPGRNDFGLRLEGLLLRMLDAWSREERPILPGRPLIGGRELIEQLGLEAGPQIGRLLERIREAQACGEIHDREQALTLAARLAEQGIEAD